MRHGSENGLLTARGLETRSKHTCPLPITRPKIAGVDRNASHSVAQTALFRRRKISIDYSSLLCHRQTPPINCTCLSKRTAKANYLLVGLAAINEQRRPRRGVHTGKSYGRHPLGKSVTSINHCTLCPLHHHRRSKIEYSWSLKRQGASGAYNFYRRPQAGRCP